MIKKSYIWLLLVLYVAMLFYQFLIFNNTLISSIYIIFTCITIIGYFYYVIRGKEGVIFNISTFFSFIVILMLAEFLASFTFVLLIPKSLYINIKDHIGLINIYFLFNIIYESGIFILLIALFYAKDLKKQFQKFENNISYYVVKVLLYYLLGLGLNIIFSSFAMLIPVSDQTPANQEAINGILGLNVHINLYIINTILIAPIFEEFIYRYILIEQIFYKTWLKYLGVIVITVVSAAIFAFMHAMAATTFIYFIRDMLLYMPFAICLSLLYIKERNMYANISLHILNNVISVAIVLNMN